jgi:hypothetical protein
MAETAAPAPSGEQPEAQAPQTDQATAAAAE